jgi:hypothetical protein
MSRRLGHPDPEALACFRAGMIRGGRGRRLSAHVSRCPRCAVVCARLDAVSAALAAASVPGLPSATERRVISAIHAESRSRASATRLSGTRSESTPAGQSPATGVSGNLTADGYARRSTRSWVARVGVIAGVVALIGCLGYLVRGTGVGTGSSAQAQSSSSTGPAPSPLPVSRLSGTYAPATGPANPLPEQETGQAGAPPRTTAFLVSDTGTRYQRSTLRAQVRAQVRDRLAAQPSAPAVEPIQPVITPATSASGNPGTAAPPSPSAGISSGAAQPAVTPAPAEAVPPKSLIGCVLHLTRDVSPEFVDRGTYQARPAYVFADADEIWVVGIDCTAARPALITAVRLGNAS